MQGTQEPEQQSSSFAELPSDYIALLYDVLPLQDLLRASSTCKHWSRCAHDVWEGRCRARWSHWSTPPTCSSWQDWKQTYSRRHKLDCQILSTLQECCWPERQQQCYSSMMAAGQDALDVLAAAAHSNSSSSSQGTGSAPFLGLAYQAHVALHYVQGGLCANRLRDLLNSVQRQQQLSMSHATPSTSSTEMPAGGAAGSTGGNGGGPLLSGALLMAEALHPLTSAAAVTDIVEQLATELRRRLHAANVHQTSRKAVGMLNHLLFGPPAAEAVTDAGNASHSRNNSSNCSSSRTAANNSRPLHCSWWSRSADLDGPDLATIVIPTDGVSGMGLKGNTSDYYHPDNSCLDSVMATGQGLPISLAVLHAEVATRAGLSVQPVNLPGHVINRARVRLSPAADASGMTSEGAHGHSTESGRGADDSAEDGYVYVDVFEGGQLIDELGVRRILARSLPISEHNIEHLPLRIVSDMLAPMSIAALLRRMLRNLVNSLGTQLQHEPDPGGAVETLNPNKLHAGLQLISLSLMCCELLAGCTEVGGEKSDVGLMVGVSRLLETYLSSSLPGLVFLLGTIINKLKYNSPSRLPDHMQLWLTELEVNVLALADGQRLSTADIHKRSEHPGVLFRVGDVVQLLDIEGPEGQGVVVEWWPVKEALHITGYPPQGAPAAAAGPAAVQQPNLAMSGLTVSAAQQPQDAAWYDIIVRDRCLSVRQSRVRAVSTTDANMTPKERRWMEARYQDWHLQQIETFKYGWFESSHGHRSAKHGVQQEGSHPAINWTSAALPAAAAANSVEVDNDGSGSLQGSRKDWLHWQLLLGPFFEALVPVNGVLAPEGWHYVPNSFVRAAYPQDWTF